MKTVQNNRGGALTLSWVSILVALLLVIFLPVSDLCYTAFILALCALPLLYHLFSKKGKQRLGDHSSQQKTWWLKTAGIQLLVLACFALLPVAFPSAAATSSHAQQSLQAFLNSGLALWLPVCALLIPMCIGYWQQKKAIGLGTLTGMPINSKTSLAINYVASVASLFTVSFLILTVGLTIEHFLFGNTITTQGILPGVILLAFLLIYRFSSTFELLITHNRQTPRFFILLLSGVVALWLLACHFFPGTHIHPIKNVFPASLVTSIKILLSLGLTAIMAYRLPQHCGGRKPYQIALACLWLPIVVFCYLFFKLQPTVVGQLLALSPNAWIIGCIVLTVGLFWIISEKVSFNALHYALLYPEDNTKLRSTSRLKMMILFTAIAGLFLTSLHLDTLFLIIFFIRAWPMLLILPGVAVTSNRHSDSS